MQVDQHELRMSLAAQRGIVLHRLMRFAIVCALLIAFNSQSKLMGQDESRDQDSSQVGSQVDNFELQDFRGRSYSLTEFDENEIVVVVFTGTECPLVQLYGPELNRLVEEYGEDGVALIAVNSNTQDSLTEISVQARRQELAFPILKDVGNELADKFGATRTPEVFVLDQERTICYQGRIDDRFGIGNVRPESSTNYVRDAIDELLAGGSVSHPFEPAVGCLIGKTMEPIEDSEITYANQVSRILQNRCVECHRDGEIAPFALTDYEEVRGWAEMIAEVIEEERMPPWHASAEHGDFKNDRRLSSLEKETIFQWVDAGAPYGDEQDLPAPRTFVSGWQLPMDPDVILPMSESPFRVSADGVVDYQYFEVDPGFTEDTWIQAAELLPGNSAVVHHILALLRTPGQSLGSTGGGSRGYLTAFVPGLRAEPFPLGMAKRIPAGSTIIFQVHYTPIGVEQEDLSQLALVFADPSTLTHEVFTTSAVQSSIVIPRTADDHEEIAYSHLALNDKQLLSMMPHMHLRGKSFTYELLVPDQEDSTLLDVPAYDFNWQTEYRLVEPLQLPPGARIRCTAAYDNSENNPYNPDPNRRVTWGEQTWDEMMIGYFDVAVDIESANEIYEQRQSDRRDRGTTQAKVFIASNDADGDETLTEDELPASFRYLMGRLDRDSNDRLDLDEIKLAFRR